MSGVSIDHYENFPVASWLCPAGIRPAVMALYRFARTADDLADEGDAGPAARQADLLAFREDLLAVYQEQAGSGRWARIFEDLGRARARHDLPLQPMLDLLQAFERDTRHTPYPDRGSLLGYCALSANPVGRLLLHLYGRSDAASLQQSDAICSALQLINFWQDLGHDLARGRLYVPLEDLRRHQLPSSELDRARPSPAWRSLVEELSQWARELMLQGAPLATRLPGRVGWELRLVVQGGLRVLDHIARQGFDTLSQRPALRRRDLPVMFAGALAMPWRLQETGAAG